MQASSPSTHPTIQPSTLSVRRFHHPLCLPSHSFACCAAHRLSTLQHTPPIIRFILFPLVPFSIILYFHFESSIPDDFHSLSINTFNPTAPVFRIKAHSLRPPYQPIRSACVFVQFKLQLQLLPHPLSPGLRLEQTNTRNTSRPHPSPEDLIDTNEHLGLHLQSVTSETVLPRP